MKCCDKCKIHVAGSRSVCPLCQAVLSDEGEPSPNPFPTIPTIYRQHNLFFRWLIFASVVAAVVFGSGQPPAAAERAVVAVRARRYRLPVDQSGYCHP